MRLDHWRGGSWGARNNSSYTCRSIDRSRCNPFTPLTPGSSSFSRYTEKMRLSLVAALAIALLTAAPDRPHRLPAVVTPEHYDLAFVVDLGRERFDGTETIRVNVA